MEARLQAHAWAWRAPDWKAAVAAGLAAAAVLMVLELLWAATLGDFGPWVLSRKVAAITMGPEVLESSAFGIGMISAALVTHYAMGIFSGIVIGLVVAGFHFEASPGVMLSIGAVFGAVIYFVNLHFLTQFFPWFADLRGWGTFIGHLVFGLSAALIYRALSREAPGA